MYRAVLSDASSDTSDTKSGNIEVELNTGILHVIDVGMYGTDLGWAIFDMPYEDGYYYDWDADTDTFYNSDDHSITYTREEVEKAVDDGYKAVVDYLESYGTDYIDEIFNDVGIPVRCVGKAKFWSPREYNFQNDELEFTVSVPASWLDEQVNTLSKSQDFIDYIKSYGSRPGFFSFMNDDIDDFVAQYNHGGDGIWKVVAEVINYHIDQEPGVVESVQDELYEYIRGNLV